MEAQCKLFAEVMIRTGINEQQVHAEITSLMFHMPASGISV